jgi:opacity protein-like surface antigen
MGRKLVVLGGCLFFLLGAGDLAGQFRVGPQASYGTETDIGIGGRVILGFPALPGFGVIGSFDYFFPGTIDLSVAEVNIDANYWEINGNLFYAFPVSGASIEPYFGAGLNLAHASVDVTSPAEDFDDSQTELAFNLLAGFEFPMTGLSPFVEVRVELGGDEDFFIRGDNQVIVTGGLLFP